MPQIPTEANGRISLRVKANEKALLLRAVALKNTSLTEFIVDTALEKAQEVIEQAERLSLSERDSLLVLELLENPPQPNDKLRAVAESMITQP